MKTPKRELQLVEKWNASVKIGDEIEYCELKGENPKRFKTRTEASILSGHTAVVWLEGKSGCVSVDHCRKL